MAALLCRDNHRVSELCGTHAGTVGQQVEGHAGFKSSRPDLKSMRLVAFIWMPSNPRSKSKNARIQHGLEEQAMAQRLGRLSLPVPFVLTIRFLGRFNYPFPISGDRPECPRKLAFELEVGDRLLQAELCRFRHAIGISRTRSNSRPANLPAGSAISDWPTSRYSKP